MLNVINIILAVATIVSVVIAIITLLCYATVHYEGNTQKVRMAKLICIIALVSGVVLFVVSNFVPGNYFNIRSLSCPSCDRWVSTPYCPDCGCKVSDEMLCANCGETLSGKDRYCGHCGKALVLETIEG